MINFDILYYWLILQIFIHLNLKWSKNQTLSCYLYYKKIKFILEKNQFFSFN